MILSRNVKTHIGKIVSEISCNSSKDDLVMCDSVTIKFTDGTSILLGVDWRGNECYISEYEIEKVKKSRQLRFGLPGKFKISQ